MSLLALAFFAQAAFAQVEYFYDEAGRLVGVIAPGGEAAQYVYDATGNIVEIKRFAAGQLAIIEFSPDRGPAGTTVTLQGIGFSTTPANNTVKFNGVNASVVSATALKLVVTVPATATTGRITVTVGANTATSLTDFVVASTPGAPTITGFSPQVGNVGTSFTVTGTNFESIATNNLLRINGTFSSVSSSSTTSLTSSVPSAATSGKLQVTTPRGTATSSADLFIPPSPLLASAVGATGRLVIDAASASLSITQTGKVGLVIFDGVAGQNLGIGMTNLVLTGGTYTFNTVYKPDGASLNSFYCYTNGYSCALNLPNLPATGTYSLVVQPVSGATGSFTLYGSTDLTGTLTPNTAYNLNVARPGQNQRLTFAGTAGQVMAFEFANLVVTPTNTLYARINHPDGTYWSGVNVTNPGMTWTTSALPATATYTLVIEPQDTVGAATFSGKVTQESGSPITVNGAAVNGTIASTGESARYTFSGTAGQNLGIGMTNLVLTGSTAVTAYLYKPDGASLNSFSCDTTGYACSVNLPNLPTTGTYSMVVQPASGATGSFTLHASTDLTGALTPNAAFNVNVARPGQNQRLTFSGTAGQVVALEMAGLVVTPATSLYAVINKPDGTYWAGINVPTPGTTWTTATLPATGTYTLVLEPQATKGAATFTGKVTLETGTPITVNGAAVNGTVATTGESARFTFSGTAGQNLGIGMTNLVLTGGTYTFNTVYKPDGASLNSFYCYTNGDSCSVNLENLSATGTYSLVVQPVSGATGSFTLHASTDLTGALTIGTPATVNVSRNGQNARYTFTGATGDLRQLSVTALSSVPAGKWVSFAIRKPDGSLFASTSGAAPFNYTIPALTVSGTYTVFIEASNSAATFSTTFAVDPR